MHWGILSVGRRQEKEAGVVCPASRARQPSWAVPGGWLGQVRQDPSPCSGPSRPGGIPYIGAVEKQPSSWGHRQIPFAEHLAGAGLGPRRLKLSPCPLDGSTGAGLSGTEISRTLCGRIPLWRLGGSLRKWNELQLPPLAWK